VTCNPVYTHTVPGLAVYVIEISDTLLNEANDGINEDV